MFDASQFEFGAAAVALTGAAIGWSLRPLFLRYRRAFVVAAAALATVGAAAYESFDQAPPPPGAVQAPPPRVVEAAPAVATAPPATTRDSGFLAEYLEQAGDGAFAERDYDTAIRYWRDAAKLAPQRGADLAQAIARAQDAQSR